MTGMRAPACHPVQFLASIQAGDLDGAVSVGETILRADPTNALVLRAMPKLCLRRDQLALLKSVGADRGDDSEEGEEGEEGAEEEESSEGESDGEGESSTSTSDVESDDDDEEAAASRDGAEQTAADLERLQLKDASAAPSSDKDKPLVEQLKRLVADDG